MAIDTRVRQILVFSFLWQSTLFISFKRSQNTSEITETNRPKERFNLFNTGHKARIIFTDPWPALFMTRGFVDIAIKRDR